MCIQHTRCKNNSTAVRCNSCDNKTIGRHREKKGGGGGGGVVAVIVW